MRQAVPAHVVVAAVDVSVQQPGGSSGAPAVQHCDVHASATQQPTLAECAVGALARMGRIDALVHSPLYVHGAGYADVLLWTSAARARATTPPHAWADAAPHAASPPHATTPHADVSRAEHIMRLHAWYARRQPNAAACAARADADARPMRVHVDATRAHSRARL
jgi:hypothetical protein